MIFLRQHLLHKIWCDGNLSHKISDSVIRFFCATERQSHKFWCDGNLSHKISDCVIRFFVQQVSVAQNLVRWELVAQTFRLCNMKFCATGTCRTKILNFHELINSHCNILPPTQSDNRPPTTTKHHKHHHNNTQSQHNTRTI